MVVVLCKKIFLKSQRTKMYEAGRGVNPVKQADPGGGNCVPREHIHTPLHR
jgi:hypothetical protein